MQGLTGLTDSQRSRLDGLRFNHNKLRARQGLAPLSLAEFADHYRAECAARGAEYSFLDAGDGAAQASSSAAAGAGDAFAQLNAPYAAQLERGTRAPGAFEGVTAAAAGSIDAPKASSSANAAAGADLFGELNKRYEQAIADARVGGTVNANGRGA